MIERALMILRVCIGFHFIWVNDFMEVDTLVDGEGIVLSTEVDDIHIFSWEVM